MLEFNVYHYVYSVYCIPYIVNTLLRSLKTIQESILPNFHFFGFPIFAVKLESL